MDGGLKLDGLCGPFQPNTSYDFKLHVFHDGKHPKALHHLKPGPLSPGLPTCESPCSRAEMKEAEPEQPGGIGPCSRGAAQQPGPSEAPYFAGTPACRRLADAPFSHTASATGARQSLGKACSYQPSTHPASGEASQPNE